MDFKEIKEIELNESYEAIAQKIHSLRLELNKYRSIASYLEYPVPNNFQTLAIQLKEAYQQLDSEKQTLCFTIKE
jgi:hypothetical protein